MRVNGAPAKAATPVRVGDEVRTRLHAIERVYLVTGLATRRGSATEAAKHFEDLTPPPPPRVERPATVFRDPGAGRPTKRDRRQIEKLRGRDGVGGWDPSDFGSDVFGADSCGVDSRPTHNVPVTGDGTE